MSRVAVGLAWVSVAASLAGFLLPWVRLELRAQLAAIADAAPAEYRGGREAPRAIGRVTVQLRQGGEAMTAALPAASEFPREVRGVQIPWVVRQEQAQATVALLELFTDTRQHATVKSFAVFLLPAMALMCGLLVTRWKHRPAVTGGVALVCAAVAALGFEKLFTLDTARSFIAITIERGVWLSLWAYVGLAASAGWLTLNRRART